MSSSGAKKIVLKQLRRLLRALARNEAYLLREPQEAGLPQRFTLHSPRKEGGNPVFRPDANLVRHCLAEDLLEKTDIGWVIGSNGRLALKRMLAGTDPFAEQHQRREIRRRNIADSKQNVVVNDHSSPLGWLLRRMDANGKPMISKTQFSAGERLAQDFQFAGMMPRITSSWAGPGTGGQRRSAPGAGMEISDNRLAARQRVRNAIRDVGSDLADILLDICCFQVGLSEAEKTRGWPRRSGKVILQIALDRLAEHYGMSRKEQRHNRVSQISHWGEEGYKPV